jgi:UDP-glucose 4-epimerase
MSRYLVTGGAGYIGSHVVKKLLDEGHAVCIFDDLSTGNIANKDKRAEFIQGSILDIDALQKAMAGVDGVMHLAAKLLVEESVSEPEAYYATNVVGSLNVMKAMRMEGVKKIVFSSTAAVYDPSAPQPLEETAPTLPVNPYGWSKLMTEQMLIDFSAQGILEPVLLRYFNVAGKEEWFIPDYSHETHLVPLIIEAAEGRRDVLKVFGTDYDTRDGSCIRDYIHVSDIAEAHIAAIHYPGTGVFNIGTNNGISVIEMFDMACDVFQKDIPVEMSARREGDPPLLVAANTKAKAEFSWEPKRTVRDIFMSVRSI